MEHDINELVNGSGTHDVSIGEQHLSHPAIRQGHFCYQ